MSQVIKLGCAAGELQRLYEAAANNRPIFTDGKWGEATLEVALRDASVIEGRTHNFTVASGSELLVSGQSSKFQFLTFKLKEEMRQPWQNQPNAQ
jgi:hypothetical protein